MKLLVTGATGFVGRHAVARLLARGHEVTALVRDPARVREHPWEKRVHLVTGEIEAPRLAPGLTGHDALVHLAWPQLPHYQLRSHFEDALPAHYRFIKALVQAGLAQVLVAGTCFEYGLRNGQLREDLPSEPSNPYALAKDTLRRFLQALRQDHPFTLQWARLFYSHGAGQNPRSLLAAVDEAIAQGRPDFPMTGGEQLRDYLPIEGVARRLAVLLEHPELDGVTNICSGRPVSVRALAEQHIRRAGANLPLRLNAIPYSPLEPMAFWGDASRMAPLSNEFQTGDDPHEL
ncbi:NAD-dependent epimerase/dehydratase family protein [Caenimonas aquaedulcis]|uniref:NAD(P)-dependent oxidoreductase n=1 Tax=Caenimonas aquaedulcis TaxID=2793270 RepID=A0A931H586_9BURK|nr:NAD(P)-dependent oxidoreductase [Caenimonas aquaedulcis]MBG9388881.1 NAD(P)-dependent oxidoreductase [Caenimonas aquaedulcis]